MGLQEATYLDIRMGFQLPAQMACSPPRQVGATYKALWTTVRASADARAAGHTKKRYRGLDQPPKYVSPTLTHHLGHDYSFRTEQQVSLLSLDGRVIAPYTSYAQHVALIQQGARIGATNLWYDRPHKQFYLLVSVEVAVADQIPMDHQRMVGEDVVWRSLAVATDTQHTTAFFPGKEVQARADHYARLRKRLRQRDTRSATRHLVVIAARERRLKQERNHLITQRMVEAYPASLIGLEDLTHVRELSKREHSKQTSRKRR